MIKVGYLISYDYELIFNSINLIYEDVDTIFLAIDENYKTWSGNSFEIEPVFFEKIKQIDYLQKIQFYFDNFYLPSLLPMECETRERNLLLKKMGNGWLIQLDVDEYIYDFKAVKKYLKKYWFLNLFPKYTPIVFRGKLITLFKKTHEGFLYIENNETFPFITNTAFYERARANTKIRNVQINVQVIHQSWARNEVEIEQKIKNWGHRDDFDTQKYFENWRNLNFQNYSNYLNFHPIAPAVWNELHFLNAPSIASFLKQYAERKPQYLTNVSLKLILKILYHQIHKKC